MILQSFSIAKLYNYLILNTFTDKQTAKNNKYSIHKMVCFLFSNLIIHKHNLVTYWFYANYKHKYNNAYLYIISF